jgi:hypothetical protein
MRRDSRSFAVRRIAFRATSKRANVSALLFVIGAVLTAEGVLAAPSSNAGCKVSLVPENASTEWRSAAEALRAHFLDGGSTDFDCREVAISLQADGAIMTFTTRDGRQAMRRLQEPDEVAPLVGAMLVTLPPAAGPERAPSPSDARPLPERSAASPVFVIPAVNLQVTAGVRVSLPGVFASPSFTFRAGFVVRSWELSAFAQSDPAHAVLTGGAPPAFSMSRYAAGIALGKRIAFGSSFIVPGVTTSVASIQESGNEDEGAGLGTVSKANSSAEPIVGAYLGVRSAPFSSLRVRAELSADAVVSRLQRPSTLDASLPPLPWWSTMISGGVDWEMP